MDKKDSTNERVLILPKWFFRIFYRGASGASYPEQVRKPLLAFLVSAEFLMIVWFVVLPTVLNLFVLAFLMAVLGVLFFSIYRYSYFIRSDCDRCVFGFYIRAHERNHLKLNSRNEVEVEKATLEEQKNELFPILLSNSTLCVYCPMQMRRVYSQAAATYSKR